MDNPKIPLIYIAGTGRCGSTVLDLLLGTDPRFFSLGELQNLYWDLQKRKKCACGKRVDSCSFWNSIIEKNKGILGEQDLAFFRRENQGKVLRWNLLPAILAQDPDQLDLKKVRDYGRINRTILKSILQKADALESKKILYLIDSSKDLYRLLWLKLSGYFDIKVIHLFKSPQGFVYSMIKDTKGLDRLSKTLRFTGRWTIENKLIEKVCDFFPAQDVIKLDYRDLAGNPELTLKKLSDFLDLSLDPSYVLQKFREVEHHLLSGNKAKFEEKDIVLDDKWKKNLLPYQKTIINLLTRKDV